MSSLTQDQETQQTPLLIKTNQTHNNILHEDQENDDNNLDNGLQRLDFYVLLMGFNQDSVLRFGLSWFMFSMIGVVVPVVVLMLTTNCLRCDLYQVKGFELVVVSSHACLAAVALLCLSHNLRKYGITEFRDKVTFINGGDYAVSSIAQVVGVILCLNAAAKISHRAQGIAALASRWHALASCGPDDRRQSFCSFHVRPDGMVVTKSPDTSASHQLSLSK
ncbi:neuropeptides B/W receptor type like protein [Tanacetum coccineum]